MADGWGGAGWGGGWGVLSTWFVNPSHWICKHLATTSYRHRSALLNSRFTPPPPTGGARLATRLWDCGETIPAHLLPRNACAVAKGLWGVRAVFADGLELLFCYRTSEPA